MNINIEIVYTHNDVAYVITQQVLPGTTVYQALQQAAIAKQAHIDLSQHKIGIYGQLVEPDMILQAGDRIEIYQPLVADPKEIRLRRSKLGRKR